MYADEVDKLNKLGRSTLEQRYAVLLARRLDRLTYGTDEYKAVKNRLYYLLFGGTIRRMAQRCPLG